VRQLLVVQEVSRQHVTSLTRDMSAGMISTVMLLQNACWHGSALPPHVSTLCPWVQSGC